MPDCRGLFYDKAVVGGTDDGMDATVAAKGFKVFAELEVTRECVRQVGQPCVLGTDAVGDLKGLVKAEMRVVLLVAYRVEGHVL